MKPEGVFRIRLTDGQDTWYEDYRDEKSYHERLVELRCQLKEQTYRRVDPKGDGCSAVADLRQLSKA
ncbi:MAG: hypothetical protein K8R90_09900 [Candidatus Cloacimonetes bacterium]|nr:hypothetical protein [Candidatus Cloacimonadota bacterium]